MPTYSAYLVMTIDRTGIIAVFHCSIIISTYAAKTRFRICWYINCACIIAICNCSIIIISTHTTYMRLTTDSTCVATVCDYSIIISTYAAYFFLTIDIRIHNSHIGNLTSMSYFAEQSHTRFFRVIEIYSTNRVILSVKYTTI